MTQLSPVQVGRHNESARVAWLEATLAKIPAGARILDAGAGERQFRRFCQHLKYVSQDFAQYDGKGDGAGLQSPNWQQSGLDIVSDITNIPEPDGAFDAALCVEVLEHVPDPLAALRELGRLIHLAECGFEVLELQENGNFFEYLAQEIRRLRGIAARYAGESLAETEQSAIHTLLSALQRFSEADRGSAELLHFGCHVLARKRTK
jgi:SAM-dependent methyltransferase